MRCLSPIIGVLIVIAILLGAAIALTLVTSGIMKSTEPSGGALTVNAVKATKIGTNRIMLEISVQVAGSEGVRLGRIFVYHGSETYSAYPSQPPYGTVLRPGDVAKIVAFVDAPIPNYRYVIVGVEYCLVSVDRCSIATGRAFIEAP